MSVAGVLVDESGRALAIRRADTGQWEPPGGTLLVEPQPLTGVYKNMVVGVVALVSRVRAVGGSPQTPDEVPEFAWLTPDQVRARMSDIFAVRVMDAWRMETLRSAITMGSDNSASKENDSQRPCRPQVIGLAPAKSTNGQLPRGPSGTPSLR